MSGDSIYDRKYEALINGVIEENPNYYIKEFVNYNSKMSKKSLYDYVLRIISFRKKIKKETADISLDDYSNYLAGFSRMSPTYRITIYAALKKYSKYLYISNKNPRHHMENIERPSAKERQSTIKKREIGFLDKQEISKYINNVKTGTGSIKEEKWKSRDLFLIELFLNTGMRCSGIWKLDVANIDIKNKTIITTEKGDKVRIYPLTDELVKLCEKWLYDRRHMVSEDEAALFISEQKKRISTQGIAKIVNKYAYNIEGKNITPHKLRATYGTQVYEATKDIYLTQQCMGHSSPTTTELYIRGQKNTNLNTAADIMKKLTFEGDE